MNVRSLALDGAAENEKKNTPKKKCRVSVPQEADDHSI